MSEKGFGSGWELSGFEEDDASSDVYGVVAEPFVEPTEEGDVDCCLYSVWPPWGLGDGEQSPVQLVHDGVGGDQFFGAFVVEVAECHLGFGGTGYRCLSDVLYDWLCFGWDRRCGVA